MAFALGVATVALGAFALASAANAARGLGGDDIASAFVLLSLALAAAFWAGRLS